MANIGSVFLGDSKRHRVLSKSGSTAGSTPPSSPSAMSTSPGFLPPRMSSPQDMDQNNVKDAKPRVEPEMSLELRLRWLEAIVFGMKQDTQKDRKGKEPQQNSGETIRGVTNDLQRRFDTIVANNDGVRKFINQYDKHAHFLTPNFALSGLLPDQPSYRNMSAAELDAFLTEMEHDIRAADRDLSEIDDLEKKGVTGAGKLADHEVLRPRLEALLKLHDENQEMAAQLEQRIAGLVDKHATSIDALSELFIAWDDAITEAEARVSRMERDHKERLRLGL